MSGTNNQLLEPISVLLHLATLPLEDEKPKIAVTNHHLVTQPKNYLQAAMRWRHGHTREDVAKLFDPLLQTYYWFFAGDPQIMDYCTQIGQTYEFRELIRYAVIGLKILQQTYGQSNTTLALQLYINMLNGMLNSEFDPFSLPDEMFRLWQNKNQLVKEEEMKKLWTLETVKQMQKMLGDCFNTSAQEDLGEEDRQSLINSKLKSIKTVLDRHDSEFRKMIKTATGK